MYAVRESERHGTKPIVLTGAISNCDTGGFGEFSGRGWGSMAFRPSLLRPL